MNSGKIHDLKNGAPTMLLTDRQKPSQGSSSDVDKYNSLAEPLKKIFDACGGNLAASSADQILIHCQCADHPDKNPSCIVSLKNNKILVRCPVCDSKGNPKAFSALRDKKLLPSLGVSISSSNAAKELWFEKSSPAGFYARTYYEDGRNLKISSFPDSVRETDDLTLRDLQGRKFPGILLRVDSVSGEFLGVHRTYLYENTEPEGDSLEDYTRLADLEQPKRLLGNTGGGHVTLRQGSSATLHLGEGPETTFAVMLNLPESCLNDTIWCGLSATNYEALEIPQSIEELHIYADLDVPKGNETYGVGLKAAHVLASRLYERGMRRIFVHAPQKPALHATGIDFDDVRDQVATSFENLKPFTPADVKRDCLDEWRSDNIPFPKGYIMKESGVYRVQTKKSKDGEDSSELIRITHRPLYVLESSEDVATGDETVTIKFYNHKTLRYQTRIVPRNAITSGHTVGQHVIKNSGMSVVASKHAEFAEYLLQCVDSLRCSTSVSNTLGWVLTPDGSLECPPYSDVVKLGPLAASDGAGVYAKSFCKSGDRDTWLNDVLRPLSHCHGASVVLGFSFASPLLKHLRVLPCVVNISGSSSTGKSISATAAMTMYGKTDSNGEMTLCTSGSSSYSGICGLLDFCHDFPFFIDEIQNATDENVSRLIYEVGNPGSTYKGLQQGGVRLPTTSRSVVIVTGEIDTASKLQYDGAGNRLIVIDTPPLEGLGADSDETAAKAAMIEDIMKVNYGHIGPEYIALIRKTVVENHSMLKQLFETSKQQLPKDGSPLHNRQHARYAAALVGCKLIGMLLNDHELGGRLENHLIQHWHSASESRVDTSVATRSLNALFGFIASHREFFSKVASGPTGEKYGQIQRDGSLALEPESLGKIIFRNSFEISNVEKEWSAAGWLRVSSSCKSRATGLKTKTRNATRDRAWINGIRFPCIILKREVVERFIKSPETELGCSHSDEE